MKIYYRREYPIGSSINEDIGFEIEVPDDCPDPIYEVQTLKQLCDKAHKELNPALNTEVDYSVISGHPTATQGSKTESEITREQQIQGYFEIIKLAPTKKLLEMHKGNIEKLADASLFLAFNNKLNELIN